MAAVINALLDIQKIKTLTNEFDYPLKGPGMMWQAFKEYVEQRGGRVLLNSKINRVRHVNGSIVIIDYMNDNQTRELELEHLISSMPVPELVSILEPRPPDKVIAAANRLSYRAFIIVILILNKKDVFRDQWVYIHSPDVRVGRIQNFRNWSKDMVPDPDKTSIGMEYFCNKGDDIWRMADDDLIDMASGELSRIGLAELSDIIDGYVARQPDAYPVYDDEYKENLAIVKEYLRDIKNLQTIGRGGTHRYNNMDHSMLTAMRAVENIINGITSKDNIWAVNTEEEYHEGK